MAPKITFTEQELRERLTPEQYRVTQEAGTERPYTNAYDGLTDAGTYHCVVCDEPLFSSDDKYNSGTGWPSFAAPIKAESIENRKDRKWFITRVENVCAKCDAHLGHVFTDGFSPSNSRYCMNSASLRFVPAEDE